jgi:hypothetical protein
MLDEIIFQLITNLSILDAFMCCEKSMYPGCIMLGFNRILLKMYQKFSSMSYSSSMIMLLFFCRTCGF